MKKNIEMKKKIVSHLCKQKKIEHKINVKWKLTLRCHNILNVLIHSMQPYKIGNKKRGKKTNSNSNIQILKFNVTVTMPIIIIVNVSFTYFVVDVKNGHNLISGIQTI